MSISIKESRLEQGTGIFLSFLCFIIYFWIIPSQIRHIQGVALSPRSFPQAITVFMFCLSVALFVSGWLKRNRSDQKIYSVSGQEMKLVALTLLILGIYTYSLYFFSYIPATIVGMAVLTWVYGQRNLWKLSAMSILLPVCIYLAFTHLLRFQMP